MEKISTPTLQKYIHSAEIEIQPILNKLYITWLYWEYTQETTNKLLRYNSMTSLPMPSIYNLHYQQTITIEGETISDMLLCQLTCVFVTDQNFTLTLFFMFITNLFLLTIFFVNLTNTSHRLYHYFVTFNSFLLLSLSLSL